MEHLKKLLPQACMLKEILILLEQSHVYYLFIYQNIYFFSNLYATLLKFCSVLCKLIQFHPVKLEQNYVNHQNKKKFIHLHSEGNISLQFLNFYTN